jgi:hypothetical protein
MRPSTSGTMPGVKPPMTTVDTISDAGVVLMAGSRTAIASIGNEARKAGPNPVPSAVSSGPTLRQARSSILSRCLGQAPRHEIDEEHHVRHQRARVQAVSSSSVQVVFD